MGPRGWSLCCYFLSVVQMATFQMQTATVNEPTTEKDVDLKLETLPETICVQ